MCDYEASPTWNALRTPESPYTLPIPKALARQLDAWYTLFNNQSALDPNPPALRGFAREGLGLALALKRALPPEWTVVLHNPIGPDTTITLDPT